MPTGYTAIIDEHDASFEEYLWRCVRGMGVCIMQRDEDMGVPARDREPSPCYEQSYRDASDRYYKLRAMTDAEAEVAASEEYARQVANATAEAEKFSRLSARYERMRAAVLAWEPPTSEHHGLKRFMLEQLSTGAPSDVSRHMRPQRFSGAEWRAEQLDEAKADMERAGDRAADEAERCRSANAWLARLRESVPQPKGAP